MLSKRKIALFSTVAILSSVAVDIGNADLNLLDGGIPPSIDVKAQAVNPMFLSIDSLLVSSTDVSGNSSGDYTPANTDIKLTLSERVNAGDTIEIMLTARYSDNSSQSMFRNLNTNAGPKTLRNSKGQSVGTYEVIDESGRTVLSLNNNFGSDRQILLHYDGEAIDPHADTSAKSHTYIRVDAKVNGASISSTTFQMAPSTDFALWIQNSASYEESVVNEVIPFETEKVDNPDLLVGQERVAQEGEDGVLSTITTQKYVHGNPEGEPVVTQEVSKEPKNRVIEIGTGVEVEVPFKLDYVANEEVPFEHIVVVTPGQLGRSINNKITLDPVAQLHHVGNLREEKSVIKYNTEYRENPDIHEGIRNTLQEGVDGVIVHQHRYEVDPHNGMLSETFESKDVTEVEMVTEIIEVGVGKEGVVPYDIIRIPNHDLEPGREIVLQDGVLGERWNDTVTKEPIEMIIEYGPETEGVVPFETKRIENKSLRPGEEKIIQKGIPGKRVNGKITVKPVDQIVEYGPSEDGPIDFEVIRRPNISLLPGQEKTVREGVEGLTDSGNVIRTPIDKIVEYGPQEIPFETEEKIDPNLAPEERKVIQEGVPGRVDEDGNILRDPINEVVAFGRAITPPVVEEELLPEEPGSTPEVPSEESQSENSTPESSESQSENIESQPETSHSEESESQSEGSESKSETIESQPETSQPEKVESTQIDPITQKVTSNSVDATPDAKPDVKTGVEGVATNPITSQLMTFGLGSMLTALAYRFKRKK